jgi:hypothetical protein
MRRAMFVLLALGAAIGPSLSCRGVTEITVEVATDEPCARVRGTQIVVMSADRANPHGTVTSDCDGRSIGSIVLVPSGALDDRVLVEVKTRLDDGGPEDCAEGVATCIVARRALRFLPHEPLTIGITMHAACAGKACAPGESCAIDGECHTDDPTDPQFPTEPDDAGTNVDATPPADVGPPDVIPSALCGAPAVFDDAVGADPSQLAVTSSMVYWIEPGLPNAPWIYARPRDRSANATAVPQTPNAALLAANESTLFWYDKAARKILSLDFGTGTTATVALLPLSASLVAMIADPKDGANPYAFDTNGTVYEGQSTLGTIAADRFGLTTTTDLVYVASASTILFYKKAATGQSPTPAWIAPSPSGPWTSLHTADPKRLFWLDASKSLLYAANEGESSTTTCAAKQAFAIGVNRQNVFLHTGGGLIAQPVDCVSAPTIRDPHSVAAPGRAIVARDDCVYYFAIDSTDQTLKAAKIRVMAAQP